MNFVRSLLTPILILQLLILPVPRAAAANPPAAGGENAAELSIADVTRLNEELGRHLQEQERIITQFQTGELSGEDIRRFDNFELMQQRLFTKTFVAVNLNRSISTVIAVA